MARGVADGRAGIIATVLPMPSSSSRPERRPRSSESTRATFLDAAERLFGERGYDATTIRAIAEAAGVNLGALHYYWGSKEALLQETCERRLRAVSEMRLQRLDDCLVRAAGAPPDVRGLLLAFLEPALVHEQESDEDRQVVGRLLVCLATSAAPEVQRIRSSFIDETSMRLVRLLRLACPQLDDEAFFWRLHMVFGTLHYAMSNTERVRRLSHGRFDGQDRRRGLEEFVSGLEAVFKAPALPVVPHNHKE